MRIMLGLESHHRSFWIKAFDSERIGVPGLGFGFFVCVQ